MVDDKIIYLVTKTVIQNLEQEIMAALPYCDRCLRSI